MADIDATFNILVKLIIKDSVCKHLYSTRYCYAPSTTDETNCPCMVYFATNRTTKIINYPEARQCILQHVEDRKEFLVQLAMSISAERLMEAFL